jgi:drug/metabolite transporter (DMT)-like permease
VAEPHALAVHLILGLAASILFAAGLLLLKSRAGHLPAAQGGHALRAVQRWLRDPAWLCALGIQILGYAIYVIALAGAPVSLVVVVMQGGIALFVLFAIIFLGERASTREWAGLSGIFAAMILLSLSLRGGAPESTIDIFALGVLTAMAIIAAALPSSAERLRKSGAAAAIASGVAFGLGSLYAKAFTGLLVSGTIGIVLLHLFENPWLYLASAANIAGLVLLQNSFHRGRGIIAMPISSACSNVVPILGGMIAFGESLPSNPAVAGMRIGAFILTICAGATLAIAHETAIAHAPAEPVDSSVHS